MQVCRIAVVVCLGLALVMISAPAQAQYELTNLTSNQVGQAPASNIDPLLANAWGLARGPSFPWWVSDNDTGWATIYDATGAIQGLKVLIPTAGNGPSSPTGGNGPGTPTGVVFNGSPTDFQVQGMSSIFIFATIDGTISAWAPGVNANQAMIAVDNSSLKAMYTGLAITNNPSGPNFLYAADNTNNHIDMYDGSWTHVKSFGDPNIPPQFSVFGIQVINGLVYVAYAVPNIGAGGFIDVFNQDGTLAKLAKPQPLVQGLPLNQAWGMAMAPSNFGPLSNTLLVSNNAVKGTINAFNPVTGAFVGTVSDQHRKPIVLNNLWAIAFGGGTTVNGATNELYVTVGQGIGTAELAGTFLKIVFKPHNKHDQQ